MCTQEELNAIWQNCINGMYGDDKSAIRPAILVNDEYEQVMSVPSQDIFGAEKYRRVPGQEWERI